MKQKVLIFFLVVSIQQVFCQEYSWTDIAVSIKSSFRALSVVNDHVVWIGGSNGWIGRSLDGGKNWKFDQVKGFETLDFRSVYSFDSLTAIIANAGSPAFILRTIDGGKNWQEVFKNEKKEAFIDGIDFWDEEKGLAYGDPINGRMLLISTKDGGKTWTEIPENKSPELKAGEASFAASGSGIRCINKTRAIITTGGKVSRLWNSYDNGQTWKASDIPILQGMETTGAFSSVFWKKKGVIVGGDFQKDDQTGKHVYLTLDNGKTWNLPIKPTRGLRECVDFLGNDNVIAIGPQGTDISSDGGIIWKSLSDEKGFHVVRKARKGLLIIAAGNGKISLIKEK